MEDVLIERAVLGLLAECGGVLRHLCGVLHALACALRHIGEMLLPPEFVRCVGCGAVLAYGCEIEFVGTPVVVDSAVLPRQFAGDMVHGV